MTLLLLFRKAGAATQQEEPVSRGGGAGRRKARPKPRKRLPQPADLVVVQQPKPLVIEPPVLTEAAPLLVAASMGLPLRRLFMPELPRLAPAPIKVAKATPAPSRPARPMVRPADQDEDDDEEAILWLIAA